MFRSTVIPFIVVLLLWAVFLVELAGDYDFGFLGVYPLRWSGLPGILTAPFVHGDFSHLLANSVPLIVLGSALFFFYKDLAIKILALIWVITGIWVWVVARPAYHIGASGIVYGLAMFLFASGIIRKHTGLMAVALVVVFLYGSLVWGIFPEFFPERNISWESHLAGLLTGLILAFFFRKEGPQRRKYQWELEEEEETGGLGDKETRGLGDQGTGGQEEGENGDDERDAYWNTTITDDEIKEIRRIYRPGKYDAD